MLQYSIKIRFLIKWQCLLVCFLMVCNILKAQTDSSVETHKENIQRQDKFDSDTADQRDVIDVLVKIFKPRHFKRAKLKPGEVSFFILPGAYYSKQTGWAATLNGTMAFLASDYKYQNLSTLFATGSYTQKNQKTFSLYSNIWTPDNSMAFPGVAWYYDYSETTYGLGSHTKSDKADLLYYKYLRVYESILKQIYPDVYIGAGYRLDYHYDMIETGTKDGSESDFRNYNRAAKTVSSGISADFVFDDRRNQINPRRGTFINIVYSPKFTSLGSDQNWQSLKIDLRKYFKLSPNSNNVLAFWSLSQLTLNGTPPYLDMPGTGWDEWQRSGRGYVQGRYRGRSMLYLESEYRFKITHNGVLGGVIFANAESFSELETNRFDRILPAGGGGVRIKLNKFTRTNLSIDYGVGVNGSSGVFLNLGEIF